MRRPLLTILFLQILSLTEAQNYKVIDSLKQAFGTAKEDTSRVLAIAELANYYKSDLPDSALFYAIELWHLQGKSNSRKAKSQH
jgi:hypothetical protein